MPGPTAETIRDALGLVRLLYATRAAQEDPPKGELEQIAAIGKELREALGLARYEEGSLGHKASLARAEKALDLLAEHVGEGSLAELVRGARARLRKGRVRPSRPDRPAAAEATSLAPRSPGFCGVANRRAGAAEAPPA